MRESFASKLPSIWLTTNFESKKTSTSSAPSCWIALRLEMRASYSTSLLEAWKPNLSDFSNRTPSGDIITTPIPNPLILDTLSTYKRYRRPASIKTGQKNRRRGRSPRSTTRCGDSSRARRTPLEGPSRYDNEGVVRARLQVLSPSMDEGICLPLVLWQESGPN